MAQPSALNPLSGPLAGTRLEFHGSDVMIGSASDCGVRIDAPGVEAYHARIVIDATGATIYRGDGPVGVNDDLVAADARLRSGDFVWIGEPAGENSIMLQFTLGDGEPAPVLVEEAYVEAAPEGELPEGELMEEMTPEELVASAPEGLDEVLVEEASPSPFEHATDSPEALEPALEFDPSHEETEPFEAPLEHAELMESHEPQPTSEFEASFDEPAPFAPPSQAPATPSASSPKVPPAPWQTASAPELEPAPADYASAWESPAKPAAPEPAATPGPPPPSPAPPPASRPPSQPAAIKRAAPVTPAKGKPDALRTPVPPPPARTTSSTPMIVGGLAAVLLLAGGGAYFLTSGSPEPAPQKPTPAPTAVAVATPPPVAPEPTVEARPPETAAATPEAAAVATPAQAAASAPSPRATPTPPTTATPGRPAAATPTLATPVPAAAAAPVVTPVPRLLEEARAAIVAKDLAKAAQLFDQALKAEPTNSAAISGKAEVAARLGALGRKFTMGATNTIGGKAAKGPTGFDLGGGAAVKADHSGQMRCTTTPAAVEPGTKFTLKCSLLNIGAKAFKIAEVTGSETVDNAARGSGPGEGSTPKQDVAPRAEVVIFEKSGSWSAANSWRLEILVKTNKDESFRAAYNWR